ncbi:MAG TPA: CRISPR-associated protein Cas5 [Bacteroidales bacterium]|nr:CRISPR-associated protein Cas5 [Bacteroidales bacterium]
MEILSFKVKGRFAHFRKYYANNTALSFSIPPRTTLMGLTAAIMGWKKDSYYERLSSKHIHFGVRVLSPLKKSFQRLNFLSIKSTGDISKSFESDFRGKRGHIQTPFEVVSAHNIAKGEVCYQVFLSAEESGRKTFEAIKQQVLNNEPVYNLSLGPANFPATLYNKVLYGEKNIQKKTTDDFILLNSAIPSAVVDELEFSKDDYDQYSFVEEDMLPGDFVENDNREVKEMNRLLFSITNLPLRVCINGTYLHIDAEEESFNIQFMDI